MRWPGRAGCAAGLGVSFALALAARVGAAFLGADRGPKVFFARFFLAFAALWRVALMTFLSFVLALPFFLVAICSLPQHQGQRRIPQKNERVPKLSALTRPEFA